MAHGSEERQREGTEERTETVSGGKGCIPFLRVILENLKLRPKQWHTPLITTFRRQEDPCEFKDSLIHSEQKGSQSYTARPIWGGGGERNPPPPHTKKSQDHH